MNENTSFDRFVADQFAREGGGRRPTGEFIETILTEASHTRQRPRWLAVLKEPPMRISSRVAVGSPTLRLAAIVAATLLLAAMATGAVVAGASLVAGPGPIVVAQDGTGTHETIADAVAAAQTGDTVLIRPGAYSESIVIDKDITLRGDGDRSTIILEFPADGPTRELFAYGILLEDSGALVENLTIRGPADVASEPTLTALFIDGGAPVIDGLDIVLSGDRWDYGSGSYYKRSAVKITGGSSAIIRDSSWDGYARIDGGVNAPTFEGNVITGQHIAIGSSGQEPHIIGNTFLEGAAIRWDASGSGGVAEDNDIDGWIGVDALNDPAIHGNRIVGGDVPDPASGYRGAAIQISDGAAPVVEDNEISDSPYGIEVRNAPPEIRGNTIRGSTGAAIIVEGNAAPTVDGNVLEDNATAIEIAGTATPVLTANALCGNEADLEIPDDSSLTLAGNTVCEDIAAESNG